MKRIVYWRKWHAAGQRSEVYVKTEGLSMRAAGRTEEVGQLVRLFAAMTNELPEPDEGPAREPIRQIPGQLSIDDAPPTDHPTT
jgi:hypothetical protein